VSKTSQSRPRFPCACIQFNVKRGDVDHNRKRAVACIRAAAEAGAKLVILPEMWPTSFVETVTDSLLEASREAEEAVIGLSKDYRAVVVGGGLDRQDGQIFNRALVVDSGKVLGSYRKIHLFSPHGENRHMSAGHEPLIADTSLGRIGVLICYDIRFPELVRYYFYRNVDILAVPSQWPEARAEHWRVLLKARAIENEMFVAGCNRTGVESSLKTNENLHFPGDSRIIDPMGETLGAGTGEEGPVVAEIEPRKVQSMRRILPIRKDRRLDVYEQLWQRNWSREERDAPLTPGGATRGT
jgi:predicted amidohydrolase